MIGLAVTEDDRHHLHWATVLDRLELEVILAERRLTDPDRPAPDTWHEPELTGPIPEDLRQRALELRERQQQVRVAMTTMLATIGRQHALASRVDRATRQVGQSVFLDLSV